VTDTSPEQLDETAARAESASTVMRLVADEERAGWLEAAADALDAAVDELVPLADEETHLGATRLTGEVARTSGQLRMFARVVREGSYLEATIDHAAGAAPDLRRMLRPIGPVAVFSASNFPFAFSVAGGDTASALAVGCPVIVKAHPSHPRLSRRTAEIVAGALRSAGAPEGVLELVEGYDAGIALAKHPLVAAVAFTGSLAGGRALHAICAGRDAPIPFYGELGSINPVVVTEAADSARGADLAQGLVGSFTLGTGQFCTKPGVVLVPQGSAIEAALPDLVASGPGRMLSDSIADGFHGGVRRLVELPGVDLVAGRADADAETGSGTPVVVATDASELDRRAEELLGEVFGPVTVLLRYRDDDDLHAALAHLGGTLTATVHAEPDEEVGPLVGRLETIAGRVLFGGWPTGVAVTWSQQHGGPWPATTTQFTSVGATAVRRFQRPVVYQDAPEHVLPEALREANPLGIPRRVNEALIVG